MESEEVDHEGKMAIPLIAKTTISQRGCLLEGSQSKRGSGTKWNKMNHIPFPDCGLTSIKVSDQLATVAE